MSRVARTLARLGRERKTALVPFVTAGDPRPDTTVPALRALVAGGADLLELGIPFSDPEADGPAIQAASERALGNGITLVRVLGMVAEFRQTDPVTPIILMGYLNSILAMGERLFAEAAAAAGVDGLIVVNLPPEEAESLRAELQSRDMELIFLAAPTTTDARLQLIGGLSGGFVYHVSLKGITGAEHIAVDAVAANVARLRRHTGLPVLVGFGIKDGGTARAVAEHADGVVVGAALVSRMAALADSPGDIPDVLRGAVDEIRQALDA